MAGPRQERRGLLMWHSCSCLHGRPAARVRHCPGKISLIIINYSSSEERKKFVVVSLKESFGSSRPLHPFKRIFFSGILYIAAYCFAKGCNGTPPFFPYAYSPGQPSAIHPQCRGPSIQTSSTAYAYLSFQSSSH